MKERMFNGGKEKAWSIWRYNTFAASCIESASTDAFAAVSGYEEKIAEVNRSVDRIFDHIEKINIYRKELFFETGDIIPVQDILSLDISEGTCDI